MYDININNFQGPLDLLLHLIKKDNIKIEDISINDIAKQYLDYISKIKDLNLDDSSEYLVMAAELIEMKSSSLLPKTEDDIEEEEDSRQRLINRLLEYEQYKNITNEFKELENYRKEVYTKEPNSLLEFKDNDENIDYGVNINDLVEAFKKFLNEQELSKPLDTKITNKEYSVAKRSFEIKKILKEKKKIEFKDLFEEFNKEYIVITFISILSLTKKQEILIEQDSNFKNIIIKEKGVL